ncbi:hypothetical protein OROMI_025290 [Orobanche minor]
MRRSIRNAASTASIIAIATTVVIGAENNAGDGGGSLGGVLVSGGLGFAGVDYEMEEGETLEDDGLVNYVNAESGKSKKNLNSDIELREIETNGYDDSNMVGEYDSSVWGIKGDGVEGLQILYSSSSLLTQSSLWAPWSSYSLGSEASAFRSYPFRAPFLNKIPQVKAFLLCG